MILGINDGHDAGVALIDHTGDILFAANEERFTGKKQQWGFPSRSLDHLLSVTGVTPANITDVAIGFQGLVETESSSALGSASVGLTRRAFTAATALAGPLMASSLATVAVRAATRLLRRNRPVIAAQLGTRGLGHCRVSFLKHHEAHAASAYFTAGRASACVLTVDAGGDGWSGSLWKGHDGRLELIACLPRVHSLGDLWLAVTLLCGFNPDRHGGKVTGLAAFKPCPEALDTLRQFYEAVPGRFLVRNRRHLFWKRLVAELRVALAPFDREQISWAAQKLLEELVLHLVREGMRLTGQSDIAVAGGVFANVKLNLEILRLPGVTSFYVHPHMGDGGTALGAALALAAARNPLAPREMEHVFLGTEPGVPTPIALQEFDVALFPDPEKLADRAAELVAANKVLGLVQGRMEYGPRALCHRTILYHPFDPGVQDWLNSRLSRTEFMPFAPVVPASLAGDYFELADKASLPARFMTICLPATERCTREAPAIVHVDGTARPQVVLPAQLPLMHEMLLAFGRRTGVPVLINTSFNRHEHPIIATVDHALEELRRGVVDGLVLDGMVVQPRGVNG
jgi:carbamoyltransferase